MGKFFKDLLLSLKSLVSSSGPRPAVQSYGKRNFGLANAKPAVAAVSRKAKTRAEELAEQSFTLYRELDVLSQDAVREYFRVTHEVNKLMMAVRLYGRCLKNDDLLERFERAERYYSGLGFLPVMPRCVDFACSESFDVVLARGLVQRRIPAKGLFFFASGVRKHLVRLDALYQKAVPRTGGPRGA